MRGLSGAEYVLTDPSGTLLSTSRATCRPTSLCQRRVDDSGFGSEAVPRRPQLFPRDGQCQRLQGSDDAACCTSCIPRKITEHWCGRPSAAADRGGRGLGCLVIVLGAVWAAHVTRPIGRLRRHVQQISQGNFQPICAAVGGTTSCATWRAR